MCDGYVHFMCKPRTCPLVFIMQPWQCWEARDECARPPAGGERGTQDASASYPPEGAQRGELQGWARELPAGGPGREGLGVDNSVQSGPPWS